MLAIVFYSVACILTHLALAASMSPAYELGNPSNGVNILFPSIITQCEAVLIFYNSTTNDRISVSLRRPHDARPFLTFPVPKSCGYIVWNCTVPAGSSFTASAYRDYLYTVQAGSSSTCLGNSLHDSSIALYEGVLFPRTSADLSVSSPEALDDSPASSVSTDTSIPISYTTSITTSPSPSDSFASQSSTTSRHSKVVKIVVSVVIGVVLMATLVCAMVFACRREDALHGSHHDEPVS